MTALTDSNPCSVQPQQLSLNQQFSEYVAYDHYFMPHEVEALNRRWDSAQAVKAALTGDRMYDDSIRCSSLLTLPDDRQSEWIYKKLDMIAQHGNLTRYGFDLTGFHGDLQLAQYTEGDFFDWHMDFGKGEASTRKLTVVVQLSKPELYEGGELQFMINNKFVAAPRGLGTAIVFPCFMQHRVTPITQGYRRTLVGWLEGPPYR